MKNSNRYPLLCGTDTSSGVSNIILKKLVEAGKKKNKPYGDDDFTELAKIEFKNIFNNKNLDIIPMISGTASNAFALSLMTKKNDYVICHKGAHILTSECGAPQFFNSGIKLIALSSNDGKLSARLINSCLKNNVDKNIVGEEKFTFQIGTLSGNPLAAVAGLKTMEILRRDGAYNRIRENGQFLIDSITKHLKSNNIEFQIVGDPTLFDIIFSETPVINYRDTKKNKAEYSKTFNQIVREHGILKADAKLYTHLALTEEDLQITDSAFKKAAEGIAAIS